VVWVVSVSHRCAATVRGGVRVAAGLLAGVGTTAGSAVVAAGASSPFSEAPPW